MRKRSLIWLGALGFFSLLTSLSKAQVEMYRPVAEKLPMFYWDVVNFRSPDAGKSRLELFLKIPYDEMQFLYLKDRTYEAKYEVSVVVFNDKNFHRLSQN